jgi:hypothetical protein
MGVAHPTDTGLRKKPGGPEASQYIVCKNSRSFAKAARSSLGAAASCMTSLRLILFATVAVAAALAPAQRGKSGPQTFFSKGGRIVKAAAFTAVLFSATPNPAGAVEVPLTDKAGTSIKTQGRIMSPAPALPTLASPIQGKDSEKSFFFGLATSAQLDAQLDGLEKRLDSKAAEMAAAAAAALDVRDIKAAEKAAEKAAAADVKAAAAAAALDAKFIGLTIATVVVPSVVMYTVESQKTARAVAAANEFASKAQIISEIFKPKTS